VGEKPKVMKTFRGNNPLLAAMLSALLGALRSVGFSELGSRVCRQRQQIHRVATFANKALPDQFFNRVGAMLFAIWAG
jgi:hypothetical protein